MSENLPLINEKESIVKKERAYLFVTNKNEELLLITFDDETGASFNLSPIVTTETINHNFVEYDVDFLVSAGEVESRQYFILHNKQNVQTLVELLQIRYLKPFIEKVLSLLGSKFLADVKDELNKKLDT